MSRTDVYENGAWSLGEGEAVESLCPYTGETVWTGCGASEGQVENAVASARRAFESWRQVPQADRAAILLRYADELLILKQSIATAISREMGKPLWESLTEVDAMSSKVKISIQAQNERAGARETATQFGSASLTHVPHGVMAVFGPFNFPGHLPNGHIIPALLAGNTCVFKPSEQAPSVASLMVQAFEQAGLPENVLCVVQGGRETGRALLDTHIDGVLFTGSAQTGLAFHRHFAGRPEIILALEMGGNNPLIAWHTTDIEETARNIFYSAFITAGQRCSCARRLILPDTAYGDKIVEALVGLIQDSKIGRWDDPDIFTGPVVSAQAAKNALQYEKHLVSLGADPIVPLKEDKECTALLRPGLISTDQMRQGHDEELFGPLLQVKRVTSLQDAIYVSNATRFGLAAGVLCDEEEDWLKCRAHLRAGILNWNRPTTGAASTLPFGGPGLSGNFRPGAYYAADYCAWPQAGQLSSKIGRLESPGLPQ